MQTLLIVGSDTGVGKTQVTAAVARLLSSEAGARIQIVKPIETGAPSEPDAVRARRLAGVPAEIYTLQAYRAPLAPPAAAQREERTIDLTELLAAVRALPTCDWRIIESAGGVASPIDAHASDWTDFGAQLSVDTTIVVVPNRLGAINQARLAWNHAARGGARAGVWLNATEPATDPAVAASNRAGLLSAGIPLWAEQAFSAAAPDDSSRVRSFLVSAMTTPATKRAGRGSVAQLSARCTADLEKREQQGLRRHVRTTASGSTTLNLADNDYLALAHDPTLANAAAAAVERYGTSASASPLITGWREPHADLVRELCDWHGFTTGLLWNSGYAANAAVLSVLPERGDLVLADRWVHHSMIAGLIRSGARLQRFEHLQLDQLAELLERNASSDRTIFVVTESVFSMDGDYPDLRRLADLKRHFGFCVVVDEAHALGWYGPGGAGLVRATEISKEVDILVGTFGKTLASGGAYTLFHDSALRDYLVNHAGEFIYSTALSPVCAAVALAAVARVRALSADQSTWHSASRNLRDQLLREGWSVPAGESPIIPLQLGKTEDVLSAVAALREKQILAGAVRPPTVARGTSRLRFSLKRTFDQAAADRLCSALNRWRAQR